MSNVATVSFKLPPEHYTVLRALAANGDSSVSELCRATIVEALDLEDKVRQMASFFASEVRIPESEPALAE